jgi:hypothetical protein
MTDSLVIQHPSDVSTKFSKHIDTFFFPAGDQFEEIVCDWVGLLREQLLFGPDDPLFPKTAISHDDDDCFVADRVSRAFWANAGPVRGIFKSAFKSAGLPPFTPHSFRNTLVQLAYQHCKTPEEFKAWSQNLGHESPLTTFNSYGKIDLYRQGELVRKATREGGEKPLTRAELEDVLRERGIGN